MHHRNYERAEPNTLADLALQSPIVENRPSDTNLWLHIDKKTTHESSPWAVINKKHTNGYPPPQLQIFLLQGELRSFLAPPPGSSVTQTLTLPIFDHYFHDVSQDVSLDTLSRSALNSQLALTSLSLHKNILSTSRIQKKVIKLNLIFNIHFQFVSVGLQDASSTNLSFRFCPKMFNTGGATNHLNQVLTALFSWIQPRKMVSDLPPVIDSSFH